MSSLITDVPGELIGEIMDYLLPHYYARLAQTCKQMNNRIWKFRKLLYIAEDVFEKYFATTEFNLKRYVGLKSLTIPKISTQITQLPHLTCLNLFKYDGSAEQASIINQLTHLHTLFIDAEDVSVTNLREMIGQNHQLTNLTLYSRGCPNDLFQLPIMSRLKVFSLGLRIEETMSEELFNMTNLINLSLVKIRFDPNDVKHFSRLINLQEMDLFEVKVAGNARNESAINLYEEFGALKHLTELHVRDQQLREEDYKGIGTLTSLECLELMEYDTASHVEYFSGLINLTRLELFDDRDSYSEDQPMPFEYFTRLEDLTINYAGALVQMQHLTRLTNLAVLGGLTAEQANDLGLLTQLRNLELPSEIEEGEVDWSGLVNVTSVMMAVGMSDEMTALRLFELIKQLQNMKRLHVGDSIYGYMFDRLKQLTQLTKLSIDLKKSQFASQFEHENWDLAALPFDVEFRE